MKFLVMLHCVCTATGAISGFAIYYYLSEGGTKVPLRAFFAKSNSEERIDKTAHPLRAENAKPNDSMSNEMKKIEKLCARIDKVEFELMDTKMGIRELALDFKDQLLEMKGSLLLQRKEIIKK